MTNWKPYPEINIAIRDDLSATWIVDGKGEVIAIDTNGDTAALERLVQCWNACRKIAFPENHIPATDDCCNRLEQLRKDAVAMAETGGGATWSFDITAAPRETIFKRHGKTKSGQPITYDASEYTPVILASKCGKVIRSYWIEKEQRWAGLANGEQPVAWMAWPDHPSERSDLGLNVITKHDEISGDVA